jgi:tRNA-binding EMAP/Myf-like protein
LIGPTTVILGLVGTRGVIVGKVVSIRPHPSGKHIWLADVDIDTEYSLQIVWGGVPIVVEDSLVAVAPPGAWLPATKDKPGPYKIRRRRYRGEISEGMLCSLAELGWDSSVMDRVALLDRSVGLRVGESLDDRYLDWKRLVGRRGYFPEQEPPSSLIAQKCCKTLN